MMLQPFFVRQMHAKRIQYKYSLNIFCIQMALLQVRISNKLYKALQNASKTFDVPMTSLVKIELTKSFLLKNQDDNALGNIFNAERDNKGKGIPTEDFLTMIKNA